MTQYIIEITCDSDNKEAVDDLVNIINSAGPHMIDNLNVRVMTSD